MRRGMKREVRRITALLLSLILILSLAGCSQGGTETAGETQAAHCGWTAFYGGYLYG